MLRRQRSNTSFRDMVALSGWLFADLLLALSVIFIAATPVGIQPKPIPTVPPTAIPPAKTVVIPTPTPVGLEQTKYRLTINVDAAGLLNNDSAAENNFKQQVRNWSVLRGRSAGLVIAYDGAPDASQIGNAQDVDKKIYALLSELGHENFVFSRAAYYDPLYVLGNDSNTVSIDVYLFAR